MSYKIEKKNGEWCVGGERFATQDRATRRLIMLLSGEGDAPRPAPAPKRKPPSPRVAPRKTAYPKGAGKVSAYSFTLTSDGSKWLLEAGIRGRDFPAAADGKGGVSLNDGSGATRVLGPYTDAAFEARFGPVSPPLSPKREVRPSVARPVARPVVRLDRYPVLGGGLLETAGGEGVKQRPFVVVEVAPGKARAFYMSTGTGGQTAEGEWNLFGGIAAGGYGAHLGWFIKPVEGKRVEKYSDVAAFLTEKFGSTVAPAWKVIQLSVPGARVFSELVGGKAPERSERAELTRKMGSRLNKYLADLGAIEKHTDYEAEVGVRDEGGGHATVFGHRRVAFNPRRW